MSDLTNDQLLDLTTDTLNWGNEVSELWAGTLFEKQIDVQEKQIKQSLKDNDLEKVRVLVHDLAYFLDNAEREYNER